MKATIESYLFRSAELYVMYEFATILNLITKSDNEKELVHNISLVSSDLEYFKIGYGSNHMWVHQITKDKTISKNRLIFVGF